MDTGAVIALALIAAFGFSIQALLVWIVVRNIDRRQRRRLTAHIFGDDRIRGLAGTEDEPPRPAGTGSG